MGGAWKGEKREGLLMPSSTAMTDTFVSSWLKTISDDSFHETTHFLPFIPLLGLLHNKGASISPFLHKPYNRSIKDTNSRLWICCEKCDAAMFGRCLPFKIAESSYFTPAQTFGYCSERRKPLVLEHGRMPIVLMTEHVHLTKCRQKFWYFSVELSFTRPLTHLSATSPCVLRRTKTAIKGLTPRTLTRLSLCSVPNVRFCH